MGVVASPILNREEYVYKMVILGYYSVGKTSTALKYVKNQFNPNEESTIGAAFLTKTTTTPSSIIKYEIWDTAGQERYNSLIPMYYRGAHVALIVYDITCMESYKNAKRWVEELRQEKPKDFLKVLIANKCDLEDRKINYEDAAGYADQNGLLFFETSALSGHNIEQVFSKITERLPKNTNNKKKATKIGFKKDKGGFNCCF